MFTMISPDDLVVAETFRWRGLVYKEGGGVPPGMPQGAINQFLRRDPPLIRLKSTKVKAKSPTSSNGSKKKAKKASKKKAKKTTKKVVS